MLQRIKLEQFKCFANLDLPVAPLTLLTGLNASGKSTVIQSLTLLHQTLTENATSAALILNGKDISLGTADDIEDSLSGRRATRPRPENARTETDNIDTILGVRRGFGIGVQHDEKTVIWRMQAEENSMVAPIAEVELRGGKRTGRRFQTLTDGDLRDLLPTGQLSTRDQSTFGALINTLRTLTYISADRIGPRETYQASSSQQQTGVGARGEYTPWFINQYNELPIPDSMCHPDGSAKTLPRQVEAWLGHFFPGSGLEIAAIPRTNLLLMRLRASNATSYYRPINVGYGLSHVLPVLTACLGAVGIAHQQRQNAPLVLVENPELHLHPAGQSEMGIFLARAAAAGAQVIIETHSDHVLNGIRRAVRGINSQPILAAKDVAIHFFQARDTTTAEQVASQVDSPPIDQDGNIERWPRGFFDQIEKDLFELL